MNAQIGAHIQSVVTLVAALIAAFTSIFVAFFAKRTQRDFTARHAELQRDLNAFNNALERGREFAGFRRERIAQHLDEVIGAYIDVYAVAQLIPLRKWLYSDTDLETEARFRLALSPLRAHFGALESLGVIPDEISADFIIRDSRVLDSWNSVLGEAALRTAEFRKEHHGSREFSSEEYHKNWMEFMKI